MPVDTCDVYICAIALSTDTERPADRELLTTRLAWMRAGTEFFESQLARVDDRELAAPSATGIETPMYATAEQRTADIEEGAEQSPRVLRFDLADALRRFADAVATMPDEAWWAEVRTRAGRAIPAAEVPWMRCREVWVHAVDLDTGVSFAELPSDLVDALIDEVVEGRAHELLGWLLGRDTGSALTSSATTLPALPAWL